MKRDMDLIQDMLTKVEERAETDMADVMLDPTDQEARATYCYHFKVLVDEGFIPHLHRHDVIPSIDPWTETSVSGVVAPRFQAPQ